MSVILTSILTSRKSVGAYVLVSLILWSDLPITNVVSSCDILETCVLRTMSKLRNPVCCLFYSTPSSFPSSGKDIQLKLSQDLRTSLIPLSGIALLEWSGYPSLFPPLADWGNSSRRRRFPLLSLPRGHSLMQSPTFTMRASQVVHPTFKILFPRGFPASYAISW